MCSGRFLWPCRQTASLFEGDGFLAPRRLFSKKNSNSPATWPEVERLPTGLEACSRTVALWRARRGSSLKLTALQSKATLPGRRSEYSLLAEASRYRPRVLNGTGLKPVLHSCCPLVGADVSYRNVPSRHPSHPPLHRALGDSSRGLCPWTPQRRKEDRKQDVSSPFRGASWRLENRGRSPGLKSRSCCDWRSERL